MIRLGPFELQKTIGAGGMGEIWRAIHLANGIPVAIKVIHSQGTEEFQDAFLHEVRLVAGLRHRNVVMALDAGTVPVAADQASGGRLKAGSPFLAMELAGGGSLAGKRLEGWAQCRHILAQLFDGLGHAHAHGIVHRDVKPGNLLLAAERSELATPPEDLLRSRVIVTDFGIGGSRDTRDLYEEGSPIGTPNYMAPEQVRASWREHGPWTDLYAAGIVAWQLATGATPFRDPNPVRILAAHLREPPPAFLPQYDVPADFEALLRQLLAKDPRDRFAFAADARRALLELGDPVPNSRRSVAVAVPIGDLPTVIHSGRREEPTLSPKTAGGSGRTGPKGAWTPTPWHEEQGRDFRLEGAGLGLYGLRAIPMVARVTERNALWEALVQVRNTGAARMVVLRGPSGTGKSRLVEWLSRAAHEEGAGLTLKAVHSTTRGVVDTVGQLAEAALRCEGLERDDVVERVDRFMGEAGAGGLTEGLAQLVAPSLFPGAQPLTRRESHGAMEALLRQVAGPRVALVWLEDAHQSMESLVFARRMMESADPLPVLLLVTIQDEELAERPDEGAFLQALLEQHPGAEVVVGPLGSDEHHELVQVLLGLEGSLAQRVEEKTQGNPLFAVQLVGDWVARGLLVPGERGFKLKSGASAEIPDDMLAVWEDHVLRLLQSHPEDDARALELAATFGLELRQSDFQELCQLAGLKPTAELVNELMRRRLARPLGGRVQRWAFVHGMLREVLMRRARTGGRWREHHRVCANHLKSTPRVDPERLARHLLEAGDLAEALGPLHTAVSERLARGDFRSSALVGEEERALTDLGLPDSDPRWGDLWLDWAWLYSGRGDNAEAERWTVRTERAARRHGWKEVLGRSLRLAARIERNLGRVDDALELLEQAEALFTELGDSARAADCRVTKGDLLVRSDVPRAMDELRAALAMTADPQRQVDAWICLADCAQRQKDLATARMCLERAKETAQRAGRRNALAVAANLMGEVQRKSGDLVAAEASYREAAERFRALDDAGWIYPQLNVGLLMASRSAYAEAVGLIEPLRVRSEKNGGQTVPACYARAVLLPCVAGLGAWDTFDDHCRWLEEFLRERKMFDGDLARMMAMAGAVCSAAHRDEQATRAWTLALAQYDGLHDSQGSVSARSALRKLEWKR